MCRRHRSHQKARETACKNNQLHEKLQQTQLAPEMKEVEGGCMVRLRAHLSSR
jgi:hypothetical protein